MCGVAQVECAAVTRQDRDEGYAVFILPAFGYFNDAPRADIRQKHLLIYRGQGFDCRCNVRMKRLRVQLVNYRLGIINNSLKQLGTGLSHKLHII